MGKNLIVAPAALGFLYDECPACYYNDVHELRKRPRAPFPSIFNVIDRAMKSHFNNPGPHILTGIERCFRVESQSRWVRSAPIPVRGHDLTLVIRGVYDSLLLFEDDRRALCDLKTTPVKPDLVAKYGRQLHAYSLALECPAQGASTRIDELGLAVFEPTNFSLDYRQQASLCGKMTWQPVQRDENAFRAFLQGVGELLARPMPPFPAPDCAFCAYGKVA